jgi:opacity protein-like surface antigen
MKAINTLILALAALGASAVAQASESTFAGLTYGQTSDRVNKSSQLNTNLHNPDTNGIISHSGTWGVRLGQLSNEGRYYATYDNVSDSHGGLKLRQENLLGSYDMFVPIASSTKLFGGGSLGMTKLSQESPGASRDTGYGYTVGAQAGVLQQLSQNASVELGYRYLRSNASTEVAEHGGDKLGSLKLKRSAQTYLSANYAF